MLAFVSSHSKTSYLCPHFTASLALCILRSRLIKQILINLCATISITEYSIRLGLEGEAELTVS